MKKYLFPLIISLLFALCSIGCSNELPTHDEAEFICIRGDSQSIPFKYYVKNDTLFVSNECHVLRLEYTATEPCEFSYSFAVRFKKKLKSKGWYYVALSESRIPYIPHTHISGIKLLRTDYILSLYSAILYSNKYEVPMSPELLKLLPYLE